MQPLINSFSTEIIKSKNTFASWLVIIGSAIIPTTLLITYIYNWQLFIPTEVQNPWNELFDRSFNGLTLFTPLFIILIIGLVFTIENKANAWKHLFVLPLSRKTFYASKYMFVLSLIIFYLIFFTSLTYFCGIIVGSYKKELNFLHFTPDWLSFSKVLFKFFIASLAIIAIHFWLSFRIKNLVANLGIGLTGLTLAILFNGTGGYTFLFPYSFPILMLNYKPQSTTFLENYHIVSIIYFIIFTVLSFFDFTKRFKG
jgi:hypothetical protein